MCEVKTTVSPVKEDCTGIDPGYAAIEPTVTTVVPVRFFILLHDVLVMVLECVNVLQ